MRNVLRRCLSLQNVACRRCTANHSMRPGNVRALLHQGARRSVVGTRRMSSAAAEITFRSPRADMELPVVPLADYMFSRFDLFGSNDALVDDATGTTYKYSELQGLVRNIGSYLTRQGYRKGDVVCYWGVNNTEFTLLLLGCASVGVVLTTANPAYTAAELSVQMNHAGAKFLISVPALAPKIPDTGIPAENIVMIGDVPGYKSFSVMLEDDGKAFPDGVTIDASRDLVLLPYSSGTTGLPKGVMLTHHNVVANLLQVKSAVTTTVEDNNLGILPFYHIYGMAPVMLGTIQDGGTLYTTPGFDPAAFLTTIQKRKITQLHLVPPIILFMARHPVVDKFDLSSVRNVISAAAPLGEGLTHEFTQRLDVVLKQGYGLSETSPVVCLDQTPATVGSVGPLISNTEAKIVDLTTGASLERNMEGEICIRGPQNMAGYLNNDKATSDMITPDGWLHTGDIGHMKDNDCIVVTDRLKELIKYKGMQVAPAELEDLLHQHPGVQDVAVIGIADDRAGELPRAYVVRAPGTDTSEAALQKYVQENVSDHKQLRGGVTFLEEIPKSPSGKILRRLLKDK